VVVCSVRGCDVCVNAKKFSSLCNQAEYFHLTLIKVTVFPVKKFRESEYICKKIHFKLNSAMNTVLY